MNEQTRQKLAELDRHIESLKAAGNRAGAAATHTQKALLYLAAFDLKAATLEMSRAGALAQEAGRYEELAQVYLVQGKILASQPNQRRKAEELLEKAAALYHTLEDEPRQVTALKELAALDAANLDFEAAVDRVTQILALVERDEQPALATDLLILRANYHLCRSHFAAAGEDLSAALGLAERSGDQALGLAIRAQQQIVDSFIAGEGAPELLESLRREAEQSGQFKIAADVQLQQANEALRAGAFEQAKQHAEAVRQAAQKAGDLSRFARHLVASTALAAACDGLNERRGVLYALLTTKAYLEQHLGQAVGGQVDQLLEAYRERWGEAAMAEAIRDYQTWMQAQR